MGEEKINDLVAYIIYEGVHNGKSEFYCAEFCLIAGFRQTCSETRICGLFFLIDFSKKL